MNIEIRNFRLGDEREIFPIHKENEDFFEDFAFSESFIAEIAQRSDFQFFVAELDGKIVGFSGVLFHSAVARAEIGPIAVKKEFQRNNIGKKLLEHTMNFLRENNIRRATIRVKAKNSEAINFFKKFGFTEEGYFRGYTRKKEDVIQLVKVLL